MTKWILNASPLITLGRLGQLSLLTSLCDKIAIPREVADEILAGPPDDHAAVWIRDEGSGHVGATISVPSIIASWDLGKGESAVLSMGYRRRAWEIVVDDGAARKCAKALGIRFLGTIGVVLRAKRRGLIPDVKALLEALPPAGFRITPAVLAKALEIAGEV